MALLSNSNYLKLLNGMIIKLHNFQSIRNRKPPWLPRAKTKMFKIPPRPVIPFEEAEELKRLHNNYRTNVRSIRIYLESEWKEKTEETIDHEAEQRQFEEDFQKSLLINKEWNEQLAPIRESFIADQLKQSLDSALERMAMENATKQAQFEQIEEFVLQVKADSKTFITEENIDLTIDQALENHVDYNYALNLNGDKILEHEKKE